ncbi:MAG TPA: hypothetical protein PKL92_02685, partial [Aquaticitalea sp.]|nr:hypothetical protein [Aquaticitalea sp.]
MKKLTKLTQINNAFVIFTLLFCTLSGAQIKQPFSARFNQTVKGNVSIIANNMLSRTATDNYNGTADNHDFTNNVYVDIDNDDTTFNSSSADFINPEPSLECLSIRKAYLYWAASDKELNSGEDNQPDWNFNDVKLMLPGQSSYITLTANYADGEVIYRGRDEVAHFDNDPYVCVKDITTLVSGLSNPFGKYQVANVEAKEGSLTSHTNGNTGTAGGWQIVFVYESPNLPQKNVTLFDGYAHVNRVSNNFNVDFNGFQTISTGNVNADIVIGALEGDRSLSGDQLQIRNTSGNFVNISTPLRLANNFFNSRITVGNSDFINRAPASTNTLGFDAAVFNLNNPGNSIIGNNQSSATIRMTSNQETYGLFLLGLAIDVYAPNFDPILLQATSGSNPANPGDTMGFSFNIQNNGNDNAANVSVSTTLPPQVEFVSATGLPAGVTHTYNPATGNLTFNFVNGITDIGDPTLNINFQLAIKDECYFLEENCNLSFDLQFVASYNGVQNPSSLSTLSSSDLLECNMGDQLPMTININQPDAAIWATAPNGLDRTVECNDTDALAEAQSLFPVTDKCEFNLVKTSGNFVADGECGNTGTYTNTWAFTDACGRTISEFVQVITVTSSGGLAFVGQLPQDETVECDQVPTAPTLTATNACGTAEVTYDETRTDGACSATYTLTRTWTASDGCGNTIEHIQTINVQDTTAPTFDGELPQNITVECDNIPDPAILTATDNCGSIYMEYKDVVYEGSCASTYTIIRSWAATDECGNFVIHEQTLTVQDTTPPVLETPASDITV